VLLLHTLVLFRGFCQWSMSYVADINGYVIENDSNNNNNFIDVAPFKKSLQSALQRQGKTNRIVRYKYKIK